MWRHHGKAGSPQLLAKLRIRPRRAGPRPADPAQPAGLGLLAIVLGAIQGLRGTEWALLIAMITLVLTAELLNTAFESALDAVHPDYHPKARVAKDVAAGAVLVASVGALAVGVWLFLPRLWPR